MKRYYGFILLLMSMVLTSCEVVEAIFKAGVWMGILIVAVIIGIIFFIISKFFGKR